MTKTLKILALNVQHSARAKPTKRGVVDVVAALGANVIVLTEWMPFHGPAVPGFLTTDDFKIELAAIGLSYVMVSVGVSPEDEKNNHILIASRFPMVRGDQPLPPDATPNALHVRLPDHDLDVVGLRVPGYGTVSKAKTLTPEDKAQLRAQSRAAQQAWMDWLLAISRTARDGRAVLLGDINSEIGDRSGWRCADRLRTIASEGWNAAVPTEGYSYVSPGGVGRRIDYAFVSPSLRVLSSAYHAEVGGHRILGRRHLDGALTDHAAYMVEVGLPS